MNRIQLGNDVFEGLNNAYLLGVDGDGPTTLVDTGVALLDVRAALEAGLADAGVSMADVDRVILTHYHPDHAGLAGEVQAAGGASVHVHEADAPLVERRPDAVADLEARRRECFERWRMPADARAELEAFLDGEGALVGSAPTVDPFRDGDTLRAGDRTLAVVHVPGHTAGLSALAFDGERGPEAFVGDALLPKYTPNVGGADVRVERPLESYLDSLRRLVGLDLARAWPGHRGTIVAPSARARDVVAHHHERTRRTLGVLREHGPCSAWEVSAHLFGDLESIHVLHGPGEASSHLDFLVRAGVAEFEDGEYAVVVEDVDVAGLLDSAVADPETI